MTQSNAELLARLIGPYMQRSPGAVTEIAIVYEWYSSEWADHGGDTRALNAKAFWKALVSICRRVNPPIRIQKIDGRFYCLDIRLIDPSVKALGKPETTGTS